jgi:hypothetical protein
VILHYDDLKDIIGDVSDARVYGGIHFRFDQDAAETVGRKIADYNDKHIQRGHEDVSDPDEDADG